VLPSKRTLRVPSRRCLPRSGRSSPIDQWHRSRSRRLEGLRSSKSSRSLVLTLSTKYALQLGAHCSSPSPPLLIARLTPLLTVYSVDASCGRYTKQGWTIYQYNGDNERKRHGPEQYRQILQNRRANAGKYTAMALEMQAAAALTQHMGALETVDWPLRAGTSEDAAASGAGEGGIPKLHLSGPAPELRRFLNFIARCAALLGKANMGRAADFGRRQLWPIFVLSRGRPDTAHLNWTAEHVLGAEAASSTAPPVVVVVSPEEAAEYRRCWPSALLLALPEPGRPVGYARHMLKRALEWRSPHFWMCDDNLAGFVRVERGPDGGRRVDARFLEAFMHVQRREEISTVALAGFLRADGTEVSKTYARVFNSISLYKVVLLNSLLCQGVEYIPALANFEDVDFLRALRRSERPLLKFQDFGAHLPPPY
jgi:hypothetical protein